jgi:hypothetical protein
LNLLATDPEPAELLAAFRRPPLYNTDYANGFGTVYTAAYRPALGVVDYLWPNGTWRRGFESPNGQYRASLGGSGGKTRPTSKGPDLPSSDERRLTRTPELLSLGSVQWTQNQLDHAGTGQLGDLIHAAMQTLATRPDRDAFVTLLHLSQVNGECLGASARILAEHGSWSGVAEMAGTTKQAAWSRWSK